MRRRWFPAADRPGGPASAAVAYRLLSRTELPEGVLYANDQLEAVEVRVSAEVTGRVLESRLVEGRRVGRGALLVRIDRSDLEARLGRAHAQAEAIRQRRVALEEKLRTWRHRRRTALTELERARSLRGRGAGSERRVDEAENAYEEARGRVGALEAGLREAAAENQFELLELQLDRTTIQAPIGGTVLMRGIEVGGLATRGGSWPGSC